MSDEAIDRLLGELTLTEQVSLLAGRDFWHTEPVERLGVGSMQLSDGPVGVRGARTVGTTSISFPCGTAIGATFDPAAAAELADALADECLDKGVHVLLGPTINLQRHPLGGRHFECYSEDPLLTASLAVAYIAALQARRVAATPKHFVANDTEYQRHTISSDVAPAVLRSLYLLPFEEAVVTAGAFALMASYNKVNGTYAAEHAELLTEVLRDEWGFDGLVMSDWFGTQSTGPSALAGLDLEMPGPPLHYGEKLLDAVERGEVPAEVVADRARRVLQLAERTGALHPDGAGHDRGGARRTLAERRALARRLAADSFVLLRNEEVGGGPLLPLRLEPGSLLAVIGPNAAATAGQGGGSAQVYPEQTVSVLDGLRARFEPAGVTVAYEEGCLVSEQTPDLDRPVSLEYFATGEEGRSPFDGPVLHAERSPRFPLLWLGDPVPGVDSLRAGAFAVRARADLVPEVGGEHLLVLAQTGTARLLLDGEVVLDGAGEPGKRFFGFGSADSSVTVALEAGRRYELCAELVVTPGGPLAGLFVGHQPPTAGDDVLIARAAELAARADVVVCVVGMTAEFETEGRDRTTMDLPGRQDELVRAVTAANARTAVLVNTGSPVTMDWSDLPAATLQLWYGGEQVGAAAAGVLSGDDEPGGRLPHTVPARLEDTPAFPHYPGEDGHAPYAEGLLIGHRHYATRGVAPRYWFGHGLSYAAFELEVGELSHSPAGVAVPVTVSNTSTRRGSAVVQAYLAPVDPAGGYPTLQFAGSAKRTVGPGERVEAEIALVARHLDRLPAGGYRVLVGQSADPARLRAAGELTIGG